MNVSRQTHRWIALITLVMLWTPPLAAVPYGQLLGGPKVCVMACSLDDGPCCCELLGLEGYDVDHDEHGDDHAAAEDSDLGQPRLLPPSRSCCPDTCAGTLAQSPSKPPLPCESVAWMLASEATAGDLLQRSGAAPCAPDARATSPRGPPLVRF